MKKTNKKPSSSTKKSKKILGRPPLFQKRVFVAITAFAAIGVIMLGLSSAFTVQEDVAIRFKTGGPSIETSDGNLWETAGYTMDGTPMSMNGVAQNTTYPELYTVQQTGLSFIRVPGLPKGRYKVTLHFADMQSTGKGERVFAIKAEGNEQHEGLDTFRKSGGANRAYIHDFSIDVDDGELSLDFIAQSGSPSLAAFELLPRKLAKSSAGNIPEPTPAPSPTPTPTPNPTPTPTPPPAQPTPPVIPTPLPNGGRQISVSTTDQLTAAIADAKPGDIILLADGKYEGKKLVGKYTGSFAMLTSGTAEKPIVIKGSRNAVIESGGPGGRYGLYFVNANYWFVEGITVTNATKGIVLDGSNHNVFNKVLITQTGQEGIHFRSNSSDNTIMYSDISYTGVRNATYGEGIYFGSANSNWGTYTSGQPDKSDRNQALYNRISFTGAESMDIKEGTTGGIIKGNVINGAGMTGSWADSWLDVKGNNYSITENTGHNALLDGFQIHVAIKGWGNNNYFADNTANVNGPGYGLSVQAGTTGNVWKCSNKVVGAAAGNAVVNGKTPLSCTP